MAIGNKITLLYAGFFSLVMIILSVFVMFNATFFYREASQDELNEIVNKIAEYIKMNGSIDDETIQSLNPNKSIEIKITNADEAVKNHSDNPSDFPNDSYEINNNIGISDITNDGSDLSPANPPDISNNPSSIPKEFKEDFPPPKIDGSVHTPNNEFEVGTIKGKRYMFVQKTVIAGSNKYVIQVFRPYYQEQKILKLILIIFIVSNIFGILLAFLIGKFISKKLLKPIVEISNTAKTISINDLSQRITVPEPNDEIRTLALTFNDMISGLDSAVEKQNQFISDASHELRTPISVIQGYANLIDRWGKTDSEILQESIDSIKIETKHMSNLINNLLFLARAEKNTLKINIEKLHLNSVFEDIVKEVNLTKTDVDITVSESSELFINGDADMLKQIIWIFIDNAAKYSTKETKKINIKLYKNENWAVFEIEDDGIGIKEEDIPHIFDRFYRGDKARSNKTPGMGLGLSIACKIIEAHKGKISVDSKCGEGTRFIVSLPCLPNTKSTDKKPKL